MRSMISSLTPSLNKISKINKKISHVALIENTYQLCNKDLNKFVLLLRKGVYLNTWTAGKDLKKNHYPIKNIFTAN